MTGARAIRFQFSITGSTPFDAPFPSTDTATGIITYAANTWSGTSNLILSVTGINSVAAAAPEPPTWMLLISTFLALAGFDLRRRRRRARAAV